MLSSMIHHFLVLLVALATTSLIQTAVAVPVTNEGTTSTMSITWNSLDTLVPKPVKSRWIYLVDKLSSTEKFAKSAAQNQNSSPMVCYFWSTDKKYWRNSVKVYISRTVWGSEKEEARKQLAGGGSTPFVRISEPYDGAYQMNLPERTTSNIVVKCVPLESAKEQVAGFSFRARYLVWKVENLSRMQRVSAHADQQKAGVVGEMES